MVTYIFQFVVCMCWMAVEVFIPYTENTIILYIQCVMKGCCAICFIHSDGFADCYHHILEVSLQRLRFLPFKCLSDRVINVSMSFISSSFCSSSTAVLGHIPGTDCYRDLRCYTKVNQKTQKVFQSVFRWFAVTCGRNSPKQRLERALLMSYV